MQRKIKVLIVEPQKKPRAETINNALDTFQKIVGGYIEVTPPLHGGAVIVCNEEGKLLGLEPNRRVYFRDFGYTQDDICGTFIICNTDGEEFASLNDDEILALEHMCEVNMLPNLIRYNPFNGHTVVGK